MVPARLQLGLPRRNQKLDKSQFGSDLFQTEFQHSHFYLDHHSLFYSSTPCHTLGKPMKLTKIIFWLLPVTFLNCNSVTANIFHTYKISFQEPEETKRLGLMKEKKKEHSYIESEIDKKVMQHIHQYRSDHEVSFEDVDSIVRSIAHDVIRSIIQNSGTNDRKVISKELRKHREFSTMQSCVTNSVSVKLRRFLSTKYSSKTEKKIFVTTLERFVSLAVLFISFLPAVEYYIEGSMLLAY